MNKSKFLSIFFLTGPAIFSILLLIHLVNCRESDQSLSKDDNYKEMSSESHIQRALPVIMPKDTKYLPIAWGAELKPIPGIISAGKSKKYGNYWFTMVYAGNIVKATNYLQDKNRERVAFADSVIITANDTFFICRRIIK